MLLKEPSSLPAYFLFLSCKLCGPSILKVILKLCLTKKSITSNLNKVAFVVIEYRTFSRIYRDRGCGKAGDQF